MWQSCLVSMSKSKLIDSTAEQVGHSLLILFCVCSKYIFPLIGSLNSLSLIQFEKIILRFSTLKLLSYFSFDFSFQCGGLVWFDMSNSKLIGSTAEQVGRSLLIFYRVCPEYISC